MDDEMPSKETAGVGAVGGLNEGVNPSGGCDEVDAGDAGDADLAVVPLEVPQKRKRGRPRKCTFTN